MSTVGQAERLAAPAREAGAAPDTTLLRCVDVSKSFGGVQAVRDASLEVPRGSIVSLIGPNGAGKTSLFNCVTGFAPPDAGEVWFAGRRIDGRSPHRIARAGLVRTFQSIRMFAGLTVYESVLVGRHAVTGRAPLLGRRQSEHRDEVREILQLLDLYRFRNRVCMDLPLLAQRKIEVARAVACQPQLLLLDEPSAGATIPESRELERVCGLLRDQGITVVLIEHHVPFVMRVSDQIHVMNYGEIVACGTPAEIAGNAIVREIYLGEEG